MKYTFDKKDFEVFAEQLGKKPKETTNVFEWLLVNKDEDKQLIINLYIPTEENGLDYPTISVQNKSGFYELHGISNYMTFDTNEIVFVAENENTISSLILGANANCNVYSNIRKSLLNADFAEVSGAELMAMAQLSILDTLLD